jgi:hypothetical protein
MGIFPHAFEVKADKQPDMDGAWIVSFDPHKFLIQPTHYTWLNKLNMRVVNIQLNEDTNLMEVTVV